LSGEVQAGRPNPAGGGYGKTSVQVAFMKISGHRVLICNCERTMALDGKRIAAAVGEPDAAVCTHLCRTEAGRFAQALETGDPLLVACTQEAPLFRELASEAGSQSALKFTNIRERAGWTTAKGDTSPKVAALLAEALVAGEPARSMTVRSDGQCLVYGAGQTALEAARRLQGRLGVSLLLTDADDVIPPSVVDVPIYRGRIARAEGHFGAFEVTVDGYAAALPSSRDALEFAMPRDNAKAACSVILDMTGGQPLFPSPSVAMAMCAPIRPIPSAWRRLCSTSPILPAISRSRSMCTTIRRCARIRATVRWAVPAVSTCAPRRP
jgi:hypothetical protein